MRLHPRPLSRRPGFTLVELLVVIAIIAILMAITIPAVFKVMEKRGEITTRNDVSQLNASVAAFMKDFEVDYVPSRLYLREDANYNANNPLEQDTVRYLQKMFPRIDLTASPGVKKHDWTGTGPTDTANNPIAPVNLDLEGDQVLVFLLGGVGSRGFRSITPATRIGGTAPNGFSTNAANPTLPGGSRKGPYFEFDNTRLVQRPGTFYASYQDYYGTPFAFFSAYKSRNGYNRYPTSDCATLGVTPYFHSQAATNNFFNGESFQIISAGKDKRFGPGGQWTADVGYTLPADNTPPRSFGKDDLANFHDRMLGIPK